MPRMSGAAFAVAANVTSVNVLAGLSDEFLQGDAAITIAVVASAAGINSIFHIGGRVIIDDAPASGANRFPVIPDDIVVSGTPALGGERLILRFRNTTAGALTVSFTVDIEYL